MHKLLTLLIVLCFFAAPKQTQAQSPYEFYKEIEFIWTSPSTVSYEAGVLCVDNVAYLIVYNKNAIQIKQLPKESTILRCKGKR